MRNRLAFALILASALPMTGCQSAAPTPTPTLMVLSAALPTTVPATPTPSPTLPQPTEEPPSTATPEPTFVPGTILAQQMGEIDAEGGTPMPTSMIGQAGQVIRVDVVLFEGGIDYHLALMDPFGNSLAMLEAEIDSLADSIAEFTLPYDGTYTVNITPIEGEGTVQVTISAMAGASGGGTLSEPETMLTGIINVPHTYHTYQLPLEAGEVVRIAAAAEVEGEPDTWLMLLGPDGNFLAEVDDTVSGLDATLGSFLAETTGNYIVIISAYGDTAGTYTLAVTPDTLPEVGEPDIVYGHAYTGNFADESRLPATFDGQVGDVLRIEVFEIDTDLDVDVILYSPYGEPLGASARGLEGEDETIAELQLPYDGRYRLELIPSGDGHARFQITQLALDDLTGGGSFGEATDGVSQGVIRAPNTFHIYQFFANVGDSITLTAASVSEAGTLDLGFVVLGPGGQQLASADDTSEGLDPVLTGYNPPQTGTYTVIVYSFGDATGTYELHYERR